MSLPISILNCTLNCSRTLCPETHEWRFPTVLLLPYCDENVIFNQTQWILQRLPNSYGILNSKAHIPLVMVLLVACDIT